MSEPDDLIPMTETVITTVSDHLPDMTAEQVQQVIAAYNAVRAGDALGTVRRDPDTGRVAHRVAVDGVHLWRVSGTGGESFNDMAPTLTWPALSESVSEVVSE